VWCLYIKFRQSLFDFNMGQNITLLAGFGNDGYFGYQHVSILTLWVSTVQFLFKAQGSRLVLFAEHMMEI
jgi:hypothetical protein